MPDSLSSTVTSAHTVLTVQARQAIVVSFPVSIRDNQARLDQLLASSSRHVNALEAVLVDEARRHLGVARARELRRACHLLQIEMFAMKGRLSGAAQTMRLPWRRIWNGVDRQLNALLEIENRIAVDLAEKLSEPELHQIAMRLCATESRAPTRPHPHLPQRGVGGRIARRVARGADAFWDGVEGRSDPIATLTPPQHGVGLAS